MYKAAAIIAAGGLSRRMGSDVPKQYLSINGAPMLFRAIRAFSVFSEVIVVLPAGQKAPFSEAEIAALLPNSRLVLAEGGADRCRSVQNGLALVTEPLVLIHDAARPYVSESCIARVIEGLSKADAVVPCVQPKSTIRTKEKSLRRSELFEVQTPQGFRTEILRKAYANMPPGEFTDDIGVAEAFGVRPLIVEGEYSNIKITTKDDLPIEYRQGNGYDIHRFVAGRPLMLGCTQIPWQQGLLGHSDADVLAHALADAMLGAANLGDIGKIWPDTAAETEGISGSAILQGTAERLTKAGYALVNADVTVIAEAPKIAKFAPAMRQNCAKALGVSAEQIAIKGTTEEGMFARSKEGIACLATVLIKRVN